MAGAPEGEWMMIISCYDSSTGKSIYPPGKNAYIVPNRSPEYKNETDWFFYMDDGPITFTITPKDNWFVDRIEADDAISVSFSMISSNEFTITPDQGSGSGRIDVKFYVSQPPAYLDRSGLAYFWSKLKAELDKKKDK